MKINNSIMSHLVHESNNSNYVWIEENHGNKRFEVYPSDIADDYINVDFRNISFVVYSGENSEEYGLIVEVSIKNPNSNVIELTDILKSLMSDSAKVIG